MRDVVFGEQSKQQPRAIPEQVPASRNRYASLEQIRSSRHRYQHHHRRPHRTQPYGLPRRIAVLHCAVNRKRTPLHRNQCVIQVTPPSAVAQRVPLSQATIPCCGSSKRMEATAPVSTLEFAASETSLQCSPPSDEWKSAPPLPPAQTSFPMAATARKVMGCSSSTRVHWPAAIERSRWPSGPMRHCGLAALTECVAAGVLPNANGAARCTACAASLSANVLWGRTSGTIALFMSPTAPAVACEGVVCGEGCTAGAGGNWSAALRAPVVCAGPFLAGAAIARCGAALASASGARGVAAASCDS